MRLSTQTRLLSRFFGTKEAIQIIKNSGFDAFDMSIFWPEEYLGEDFRQIAEDLREYADSIGIPCNQAHSPHPTSCGEPEKDALILEDTKRAIEFAGILGADNIIVHPYHHRPYPDEREISFKENVEFFSQLIPIAEKSNINIAIENMFDKNRYNNQIKNSVCSSTEELAEYVDYFNTPHVVACLDVGHIGLVGGDLYHEILALGPRLKALHVHDNNYIKDMHTLPYTQCVDYEPFYKGLKEISYSGDFTFEADNFFYSIPDPVKRDAIKFMHSLGRHMVSRIEN